MTNELVTGLTVFYKTPHLIDLSLKSFRRFYPDVKLIIVDQSGGDDCTESLRGFVKNDKYSDLIELDRNYGHGPGLNRGIKYIQTPYVYIFDSDSEMIRADMLEKMLELTNPNVYGVGWSRKTTRGGSHRDGANYDDPVVVKYLHPLACLISMKMYKKFRPFRSGGAPFCEAMSDIKDTGRWDELIVDFPVIGSRGQPVYIRHGSGHTRARYGVCRDYVGY
jgi:glycosyltransferase involved in cell wall biosynthesis